MISYVCAFLAAVANASSNVLNRTAAQKEPGRFEFSPKLILDLLRRRIWLLAVAITLVSFLLGATALGTGQLAAVQIIIIIELPLTLIGGAKFLGSQLGRREWAAIAGLTAGVIGLLGCLDPQSGPTPKITPAQWIMFLLSRSPVLQAHSGESPGEAPEDSDSARHANARKPAAKNRQARARG